MDDFPQYLQNGRLRKQSNRNRRNAPRYLSPVQPIQGLSGNLSSRFATSSIVTILSKSATSSACLSAKDCSQHNTVVASSCSGTALGFFPLPAQRAARRHQYLSVPTRSNSARWWSPKEVPYTDFLLEGGAEPQEVSRIIGGRSQIPLTSRLIGPSPNVEYNSPLGVERRP